MNMNKDEISVCMYQLHKVSDEFIVNYVKSISNTHMFLLVTSILITMEVNDIKDCLVFLSLGFIVVRCKKIAMS